MNQPPVYMCPLHPEHPLPNSSLPHPSWLSQSTGFECPASCIELALVIYFIYGNVCALLSRLVVSDSLQTHGLQPASLLCLWGFSRQEYQSGLPCPPPWDLPNPGIEALSLLHCRQILYQLSYQGNPMIRYIFYSFFIIFIYGNFQRVSHTVCPSNQMYSQ